MRDRAGGVRIPVDPNGASNLWPGHVSAYRPPRSILRVGDVVTVVQEEIDEPDYVGTAKVIGLKGRFVGLDIDWSSFVEEDDQSTSGHDESPAAGELQQAVWELTAEWSGAVYVLPARPAIRLPSKSRGAFGLPSRPAALTAAATAGILIVAAPALGSPQPRPDDVFAQPAYFVMT